jgi:hypothetical protein
MPRGLPQRCAAMGHMRFHCYPDELGDRGHSALSGPKQLAGVIQETMVPRLPMLCHFPMSEEIVFVKSHMLLLILNNNDRK